MTLLDEVRVLLAKRKYAVLEVQTAFGTSLLLDPDDPEGGAGENGDAATTIEIWQDGDLVGLDAAGLGTVKFDSADELDRFVYDLLCVGWENINPGEYRLLD